MCHERARRRLEVRTLCAATVLLSISVFAGCGSESQISGDREAMKSVDALWTAGSAKKPELVDSAFARLETAHATGRLPEGAFQTLQTVVDQAKAADWAAARDRLKRFIRGQRPAQ